MDKEIEQKGVHKKKKKFSTDNNHSLDKEDSPQQIKSTAIVKYSAVQVPGTFTRLQFNTDLKSPPANWLNSSAETYGLQHVLSHSKGYSSFRMAHMFPDCVAKVDVISDAENIKNLLKIPYSRDAVSMVVHCVEKTLLIDEFDVHKHLLRTAESDWDWLRKFFYEHVLQTLNKKEKIFSHKGKSRYALQKKSLMSKFLHHSLEETSEPIVEIPGPPGPKTGMTFPLLPEPPVEEELPDPTFDHTFNRNVVWTFEDIQMLLGTDLPIFGGVTHPCISLRLKDMNKPISVLTGIDYWLDNLMCNVPEVVMCYHLDGIVQRYELIKTEDLPHMCDSKFSPKIIRDVAQNILSFLKANATKAGHTYWLFKGKNEDVVKLYDLTCLCSESLVEKGQNPFTIPVAMLLYRVARNMKHSAHNTTTLQPGTIRVLLKNCLSLLPKEKYPQIVASANYMLSDLYVPVNTDPSCPCLDDELPCSETQEDGDSDEEFSNAIKTLSMTDLKPKLSPKYTPPPPMVGKLEDRCRQALEHVTAGLQSLQYFDNCNFSTGDTFRDVINNGDEINSEALKEEPKMAHSFQAIPMPYTPLDNSTNLSTGNEQKEKPSKKKSRRKKTDLRPNNKKSSNQNLENKEENSNTYQPQWNNESSPKALLCKENAAPLPTWQQPEKMDNAAWQAHLKILLYEKACLVYTTLVEKEYSMKKFGRAMSYIKYVLRCQAHVLKITGQENIYKGSNNGLVSYLLGRAGDCCIQLVQNWDEVSIHRADLAIMTPVEESLEAEMAKDIDESDYPPECQLVPEFFSNNEQILHAGFNCYQQALKMDSTDSFRRRIGNAHNELAAFYMNQILLKQSQGNAAEVNDQIKKLFELAQQHLDKGQAMFESVKDAANLALLQSNHGKLMRIFAHYDSSNRRDISPLQQVYFKKAMDYYKEGLNVLKNRKNNPIVWDSIKWEMSTMLNTMATLSQEYPQNHLDLKSQEDCEKEVVGLLMKALESCDLETQSFRLPQYQFRAAILNYRIGSFYHHSYRSLLSEDFRKKNYLHLAQLHYERSSQLLENLGQPIEFLRLQIERAALQEFLAKNTSNNNTKIKNLHGALEYMVKTKQALVEISQHQKERSTQNKENQSKSKSGNVAVKESDKSSEDSDMEQEETTLLNLLESRLQVVLRTLCQLCKTYKLPALNKYKEMYSLTLKQKEGRTLCVFLREVFNLLEPLLDS
uniref:Erythroid differentiation-related factor 1 n=1 Tax=Clastoptera arizonana TaxID=38151 RepID=A0A1B6CP20_9HEMI